MKLVIAFLGMFLVFIGISEEKATSDKPDTVLLLVKQSLQSVFEPFGDEVSIEYGKYNDLFAAEYRTRKFMIHKNTKIGYSKEATEQTGPDFDGFILKVFLQDSGTVNQIITPVTIREPYWKTDLDVVEISGTSKQIYYRLSYGGRTDTYILYSVRKALGALTGIERFEPSTREGAEVPIPIEKVDELTGIFRKSMKALSPYLLDIDGGNSIYLRGDILKDVKNGTRIWIKGEIHSSFFDHSSDLRPAMMPRQWHIFVNVEMYRKISKPFEIPKKAAAAI